MKMILEQKQMMKMVMTQELRQAIEILQLPTYELLQYIQQKANENPFIELIEKEHNTTFYSTSRSSFSNDETNDPFAHLADEGTGMHDSLFEQLLQFDLTEEKQNVVRYLILNINEQGYIPMEDDVIADYLNVLIDVVEDARSIITSLEPVGIGARDMVDCLFVQAKHRYSEDVLLHDIICNHLQDLADKRWEKLANQLAIPLEKIQEVFQTIQTLDPRPAMQFTNTNVHYITPDITIDYDKNDQLTIQLHEHYIPNIHFNRDYVKKTNETKEISRYVQSQYEQFEWLRSSIEQRRRTILKIMEVLIRYQASFFKKGFRFLKPLTLKTVAEKIEMHESTVSRATANKVIQTPVGIFELKDLFSTKISSKSDGDSSQAKVKELIKELIAQEDKYKPLSDQKIADQLQEEKSIKISRRTVAKYREEMMILSSSKRKEVKV